MADRAQVFEGAQIGVESTYGVSVAADKKLQAMNIDLSPSAEVDTYGPMGQKYDSLSIMNREWVEASLSGRPSFNELQIPLSSIVGTAVITTPATGVTARDWDWTPLNTTADVCKSFTAETGQAGAGLAEKATGLILTELGMSFSRTGGVDLSGSAIARALLLAQTLTAAPTALDIKPVAPGMVSVYIDDTAAGLGTTKSLRSFSTEWRVGDRRNPIWPLNAALTSYDGTIETKPTPTFALTLGNDAEGQAFYTTMRTGAKKFIRVEAVGPIIELALTYLLRIDACIIVADGPSKSDVDGLSSLDWSFRMAYDATFGAAYKIKLRNTQTAL